MKLYQHFYDIEVFPNYFAVEFKRYRVAYKKVFTIWNHMGQGQSDLAQLCDFVRNETSFLIGYNNKDYDDRILNLLLAKQTTFKTANIKLINDSIYELSSQIIAAQQEHERRHNTAKGLFKSVDLILMFNRIDRVSLKQIAINLKWPTIQDLPYPPDTIVTPDMHEKILRYLSNDVNITEALLETQLVDQFNERIAITLEAGFNVVNLSETDIAKRILQDSYSNATGLKYGKFKDLRTPRPKIRLADCISPKVHMITREGTRLMNKMMATTVIPKDSEEEEEEKFKTDFFSKHLVHDLGLGGMHSRNKPFIYKADDKYAYWDLDVSSYYPRIIVEEGLYPQHLGPKFTEVYANDVFWPRIEAKKAGNDTKAGFLKIAANATFGLTRSRFSWLYDHKVGVYICITGQLFLAMLIEWLETYSHCIVIYSNTDGLTVQVPRDEQHVFFEICNRWQRHTKMELEFAEYYQLFIRDVNNYLIHTTNPKKPFKAKGCFLPYGPITKGYEYPIVAKSLYKYFMEGIPVSDTIMATNNIYDFMIAERTNMDKFVVIHQGKSGKETKLQKNNRWIVTDSNAHEGTLYKRHLETHEVQLMQKGFLTTIVNDVPVYSSIDEFNIDYGFYINEALKTALMLTPMANVAEYKPVRVEQGTLF